MKKKVLQSLLILIIFIFGACRPQQNPLNIINLNKAQGLRNYSNIYSLPKTVIRVNVTAERINYFRGPYYQYAEMYLGLSDVISENGHKWRISAVEFETYPIADTNNIYLIETNNVQNYLQFQINKDGFIQSINDPEKSANQLIDNYSAQDKKQMAKPNPLSNFSLNESEPVSFDEVPIPKAILAKKSISEQASAFANTILTLRDDRAAILVGDGYCEALPVGETLKAMIQKIDEIQSLYLSTFSGKVTKESFTYSFDFIPDEARKITQSILFRFSPEFGILGNNDMSGMPIIIEIESFENLRQFEQFKKRQYYLEGVAGKNENEKGFYYRIPEMGVVKLIKNEKILMQDKIHIAQYGTILHLPYKYLDGNYTIQFYPELGSIKSIYLNKPKSGEAKTKNKEK